MQIANFVGRRRSVEERVVVVFEALDLPERLAAGEMHGSKCIGLRQHFQRGNGKTALAMELLNRDERPVFYSCRDNRIPMLLPETFELTEAEAKGGFRAQGSGFRGGEC